MGLGPGHGGLCKPEKNHRGQPCQGRTQRTHLPRRRTLERGLRRAPPGRLRDNSVRPQRRRPDQPGQGQRRVQGQLRRQGGHGHGADRTERRHLQLRMVHTQVLPRRHGEGSDSDSDEHHSEEFPGRGRPYREGEELHRMGQGGCGAGRRIFRRPQRDLRGNARPHGRRGGGRPVLQGSRALLAGRGSPQRSERGPGAAQPEEPACKQDDETTHNFQR